MFKILIGAVALFVCQIVFFEQSTRVLVFSHNVFSEAKVVYHASKQVIENAETIEKFDTLVTDLKEKK